MTSLVASRHFASAAEGDNKSLLRFALFLSPIVKISLTLYFATSPEGGSKFCDIPAASTEEFTPEGGSDCLEILVRRWKLLAAILFTVVGDGAPTSRRS